MTPFHLVQLFIISTCVYLFTLFAYFVHQTDLWMSRFQSNLQLEYDFIIVGSGTAGSLIAHRLATETNYTFIVLEAGSRSHALLEIPVLGPLLHGSVHDWNFESIPQENACLAMVENKCKLTQGKILGGSSKLNNMIHVRGNISHYVDWFHGQLSEEYIRSQFDKLENEYLHLNNILHESELSDAILNAAKELGFWNVNENNEQTFTKSKLTQKDGKRWTITDNLEISKHVKTNAFVEKLLIKDYKCIGVKLYNSYRYKKLYAKKGVIVSAGAFNSPKILQLSGIGPLKLLNKHKIPVVKNLPVGKNLQDHIGSGLDLLIFNSMSSSGPFNLLNPMNIYQYFFKSKGPLTSPGCEVVGFLSTRNETAPDLQFMVLPVGISSDRGSHLRKSLGLKSHVWDNYFSKLFDEHTATIFTVILQPKSKGKVYIGSKDPLQKPMIDPKFLTSKNDVDVLVNGFNLVKKFIETDAMKAIGAKINLLPFPGCEGHEMFSNSYWECYIKHLTLTSYHPVGTCSMGLSSSVESVVDTSFKVIGIKNLFVVDSSVLPTLPSANINAAIAMMASIFFELNIKSLNRVDDNIKQAFCYRDNFFVKTCMKIDKQHYAFKSR